MPHCASNARLEQLAEGGTTASIDEMAAISSDLLRCRAYIARTAGAKRLYEAAKAFTKRVKVMRDTTRGNLFTVDSGQTAEQAIAAARTAQAVLEDAVKAYEEIWEARK